MKSENAVTVSDDVQAIKVKLDGVERVFDIDDQKLPDWMMLL